MLFGYGQLRVRNGVARGAEEEDSTEANAEGRMSKE